MSKTRCVLAIVAACVLMHANVAKAEFIGNAFGGQAEEGTRTAASRIFEGYQSFYLGMSHLERRSTGPARDAFQTALAKFKEGQIAYQNTSGLLRDKTFQTERLSTSEAGVLMQFLAPFGAKTNSDQSTVINAYATSFARTITLIDEGSREMTLNKFREIQNFIYRQVIVGTLISGAMGR